MAEMTTAPATTEPRRLLTEGVAAAWAARGDARTAPVVANRAAAGLLHHDGGGRSWGGEVRGKDLNLRRWPMDGIHIWVDKY